MSWRVPLAVVAVAVVGVGASAVAAGDDPCRVGWWPQPEQSSCANSSADNPAAPSPATVAKVALAWSYESDRYVATQPVVSDGTVYIRTVERDGPDRPRLRALELASGKEVWQAFAGEGSSPPLVDGDVLLRLSSGWVLRRYGLRQGQIAWGRRIQGPQETDIELDSVYVGTPVAADGNWYISTGAGLIAYGERVGKLRWARTLECATKWCGVAAASGRVYVADAHGLYALDARTGATVWSTRVIGNEPGSSVVLAGGMLFTSAWSPHGRQDPHDRQGPLREYSVEAFAAGDGHQLWQTRLGSAHGDRLHVQLSASASLVVFPAGSYVYALDPRTGQVRWKYRLDAGNSVPALVNGLVWVVNDKSASLVALDQSDGRQLWSAPLGESFEGKPTPSPVVAANTILLQTPRGRLFAYRLPS